MLSRIFLHSRLKQTGENPLLYFIACLRGRGRTATSLTAEGHKIQAVGIPDAANGIGVECSDGQGGVWLRLKFGRLNIFSLVWSGLVWLKRVWLFGCHSCPYISIFSLHTLQKLTKIWVIDIKQCEIESIKDLASFNSSMGCYKLYCVISSYFKFSSYFTHSLQPNFSQTPAE